LKRLSASGVSSLLRSGRLLVSAGVGVEAVVHAVEGGISVGSFGDGGKAERFSGVERAAWHGRETTWREISQIFGHICACYPLAQLLFDQVNAGVDLVLERGTVPSSRPELILAFINGPNCTESNAVHKPWVSFTEFDLFLYKGSLHLIAYSWVAGLAGNGSDPR